MKQSLIALVSGTLFGAGLAVSQMTNPAKVIGFLDVAGHWDPSLAFVMGAALVVSALAFRIDRVRGARSGALPGPSLPASGIDRRLLLGAALFGLGWGLAGFCPGPAVAALVTGSGRVLLFVGSMVAGMVLFKILDEAKLDVGREEAPSR